MSKNITFNIAFFFRRLQHCWMIFSMMLLTACSSLLPLSSTDTNQPLLLREYRPQIDMSGRLSTQYEEGGKQKSAHINFTWSQTPEKTSIALGSPTGQTLATIIITNQGAQFIQADKPVRFAADANQLCLDILGWPLPIEDLRDWLQGYLDHQHQAPITQATSSEPYFAEGWKLQYVTWQIEHQIQRPKRIDLTRQTEQAGLVVLRIVVDEWSAP